MSATKLISYRKDWATRRYYRKGFNKTFYSFTWWLGIGRFDLSISWWRKP